MVLDRFFFHDDCATDLSMTTNERQTTTMLARFLFLAEKEKN